jgi:Zn finger protein HypA/HybF involved in hydrogenase expression
MTLSTLFILILNFREILREEMKKRIEEAKMKAQESEPTPEEEKKEKTYQCPRCKGIMEEIVVDDFVMIQGKREEIKVRKMICQKCGHEV